MQRFKNTILVGLHQGFHKASDIDKVQNQAMYFLGVHKFAPNAALTSEMGWIRPQSEKYICMLRVLEQTFEPTPGTNQIQLFVRKFSNKTIIFVMEIGVQNLGKYVNY